MQQHEHKRKACLVAGSGPSLSYSFRGPHQL